MLNNAHGFVCAESIGSVGMIEGLLVRVSPTKESLNCVLEQDTLLAAYYWFNPGRSVPTWLEIY